MAVPDDVWIHWDATAREQVLADVEPDLPADPAGVAGGESWVAVVTNTTE